MTFPPFSEAEVLMTRPVLPIEMQEPPVQTANDFARRMALLGKPGPYRASHANPGVIVDRADHIVEIICPDIPGAAARRDAAEITALALNRLCGFAAIEDQLDAVHIAAVRLESDRFAAQARPQAAE